MHIRHVRSRLVALAAALAVGALAVPAHAVDEEEDHAPCVDVGAGKATFAVTSTTGKKKRLRVTGGHFMATWQLDERSCEGATYVLTLRPSVPGLPLGWTTDRTDLDLVGPDEKTRAWGSAPTEPWPREDETTPLEVWTVDPSVDRTDGTSATIAFDGDGITHTFVVLGTTGESYDSRCLSGEVTTYDDAGSVVDTAAFEDCDDSIVGGTSYN